MEAKLTIADTDEIKESVARRLAEIQSDNELQAQCSNNYLKSEEVENGSNVGLVILLALFMFLISGLGVFFVWKKNQEKQANPGSQQVVRDEISPEEMKNTIQTWVDTTTKRIDALEKRVESSDKRLDLISNRQWALSIAFNNNASIQQYALSQTNPDLSEKVIWLDPEWKLNKSPAFIQLTDEDRKNLMQVLK